jgi:hypothetical protein
VAGPTRAEALATIARELRPIVAAIAAKQAQWEELVYTYVGESLHGRPGWDAHQNLVLDVDGHLEPGNWDCIDDEGVVDLAKFGTHVTKYAARIEAKAARAAQSAKAKASGKVKRAKRTRSKRA